MKQGGAAAVALCAPRAILASCANRAASSDFHGASIADLQQRIPRLMADFGVPGLAIALLDDARIVWQQGFGVRELATKAPVTAETIFEAASLSKPTFACAVLRLCEQGVLSLDTPLTDYLPASFIPAEPRAQRITARMILSHTSGLPHGRSGHKPLSLRFTPGTKFSYSATGYDYLQKVVERLTRQTLAELMRQLVLQPCGMAHSSFGWAAGCEANIARGHDRKNIPGETFNEKYRTASAAWRDEIARLYPELSYPDAAAGMYTTPGDFARLMCEIIRPAQPAEAPLPRRMLTEMLTPQVRVSEVVSWGLGWGLLRTKADDVCWHWGNWNGLFQHFAAAYKEQGRGVVVTTNSGNGLRLCKNLVPAAIGLDLSPLHEFIG